MRHEKAGALLALARRLAASAEGLTLDEMGNACEVGRRTAERMRDALIDLFPQIEEMADGASKRWRIPAGLDGFFNAPSTEELTELGKAAAALRAEGAEPRARTLEGLRHKIEGAVRRATLNRMAPDMEALAQAEMIAVAPGPRPFEDPAMIAKLREAILAQRALRFRYRGGSTPGAARTVTPYGMIFGRANYLVAPVKGATRPVNWRLDRIEQLEILEAFAARPEGFSLTQYASRSFGIFQDQVEEVVLEVTPSGAEDALGWRFHPTQQVERQADGSVMVRFRAGGMRELAWHLFTWGETVRILAPERLKEEMAGQLARAVAWHGAAEAYRSAAT
ncbi:MAG TPA: WYL domain-containing protein [Caulobacteraceae bacterium]|nr:WYL domain-containing protein [Caulobacteraceae bacterium]